MWAGAEAASWAGRLSCDARRARTARRPPTGCHGAAMLTIGEAAESVTAAWQDRQLGIRGRKYRVCFCRKLAQQECDMTEHAEGASVPWEGAETALPSANASFGRR